MLDSATPTGPLPYMKYVRDGLADGDSQSLPPLQVKLLLQNRFLLELARVLGNAPYAPAEGLRVAKNLDVDHLELLFGEIALRPTFVDMFRSFLDYDVAVPYGADRQRIHPDLAAAIQRLDLQSCSSCGVHVLAHEQDCWMCAANRVITRKIAGFRGVHRLCMSTILERAVIVPEGGLPVAAVTDSVIQIKIHAGALLTTMVRGEVMTRYYRICTGDAPTYLRVIRSGIYDFVSYVSGVEILEEFPKVPPGFLSWF